MKAGRVLVLILYVSLLVVAIVPPYIFAQEISENWITNLVVAPTEPQTIYASTFSGGVFKSQDEGKSWQDISQGLPENAVVQSLFFDLGIRMSAPTTTATPTVTSTPIEPLPATPLSPPTLVVTGPVTHTLLAGTSHHGLFYSSDQGENWFQFPSEGLPENVSISDVIVDAQGRIFIGTLGDGVFGFETGRWVSIDPSLPEIRTINQLLIDPRDLQTLYAVVPNGIYRFGETGRWEQTLNLGRPIMNDLLVDPIDPQVWYLGTSIELIRSGDGGATWPTANLRDINITALAFAPTSPPMVYAGTSNGLLYHSSDQGMHWSTPIEIVTEGKINVLAVSSTSPSTLFAGTSDGLYISENNGESWHVSLPLPPTPTPTLIPTPTPTPTPTLSILDQPAMIAVVSGVAVALLVVVFIAVFIRGERAAPTPETLGSQVQEAFDSLKRSEIVDNLLNDELEVLYVDYNNNLETFLQRKDHYIVGYRGAGKTMLFFRGFAECTYSWVRNYTSRQERFLREPNTLAIYLSLREFELADFPSGSTEELATRLLQALVRNLLEQASAYHPSLIRQTRKLFDGKKYPRTISEFLDQIQALQKAQNISTVHLLIDDFSSLDSRLQMSFATIFRRLIFAKGNLYLKLAVVSNEFNLGEIERQRDLFEFSLNLSDFFRRSPQPKLAYQKMLDISDEIIGRRVSVYTKGTLSLGDILEQNRDEIVRAIVDSARGIPRTMGLILSQSWRQVTKSGKHIIELEDLWTPPSSPNQM